MSTERLLNMRNIILLILNFLKQRHDFLEIPIHYLESSTILFGTDLEYSLKPVYLIASFKTGISYIDRQPQRMDLFTT